MRLGDMVWAGKLKKTREKGCVAEMEEVSLLASLRNLIALLFVPESPLMVRRRSLSLAG